MDIKVGDTHSETTIVDSSNTAKAVKSGSLDVLATPAMIALMERAAANCLADKLPAENTSVGTMINIEHLQASPIGAKVTATATVTGVDRRKISFEVVASTPKGIIGRGTHTRFIVDTEEFMNKISL